jgi:hypothetical protein
MGVLVIIIGLAMGFTAVVIGFLFEGVFLLVSTERRQALAARLGRRQPGRMTVVIAGENLAIDKTEDSVSIKPPQSPG